MNEIEEWQKEYIEYFEKQNIKHRIYVKNQINLIFDSYEIFFKNSPNQNNSGNIKTVWAKLYKIKNINNSNKIESFFEKRRNLLNVLIKENDFHFFIKISSNDYSAFPAFTPENLIERIKYCISSFKKYEKQIIQLDRYGEILNLDDIEKYIPSLVNLTKNSEQRLKVLISKLQELLENSKNTINSNEIESMNDLINDKVDELSIEEELNSIIGLNEVKNHLIELESKIFIDKLRKYKGLKTNKRTLHTIFMGNPGTGKTTIARLFGRIMKEYGILNKGHVIEVSRKDLVGEYTGQTPLKTFSKIKEAFGGIFFIDEAYSLVKDEKDNYGNEAIDTILKAMEDYRDDFIVIAAGYPEPMKKFIDSNPGLESRFTEKFNFTDYSVEELLKIANIVFNKSDYILDDDARLKFEEVVNFLYDNKDDNFGNARVIRNIIEDTIQNQNFRLAKYFKENKNSEEVNIEKLKTINKDDIDSLKHFLHI